MAFQIDPNTMAVTMHRGDTGAFYVTLTRSSGEPFDEGDVAIYTVKQGNNTLIERVFELGGEDNGRFLIAFRNSDTDTWAAGSYSTEIRVVLNPIYNLKLRVTVSGEITVTVDEDTCLAQFTDDSGTKVLTYTDQWSEDPATYGITVTGTPESDDAISIQYNKNANGEIVDGDTVRTITKSKSRITIEDVQKEV